MRVLVTGATGFVGRWLVRELEGAGHTVVAAPPSADLDITDAAAVGRLVTSVQPDAIAHLAAVSYAGDANRDPERALRVNELGTTTIIEAAAGAPGPKPVVLVTGSSEVYGRPGPGSLPLREDAPTLTDQPYGLSKLAQERAAIRRGAELSVPVVVTRAFNHTGPGQRPDFVAPALAQRILAARASGSDEVVVGNIDVRRDFADVRDVVRAYRLLLEALAGNQSPASTSARETTTETDAADSIKRRVEPGAVVNVATGRSVAIRQILELLAEAAGIEVTPRIDPALVRANDPPEIIGNASLLHGLTGWEPTIPLEKTLRDLIRSIEGE